MQGQMNLCLLENNTHKKSGQFEDQQNFLLIIALCDTYLQAKIGSILFDILRRCFAFKAKPNFFDSLPFAVI